jgi:hypothetical protein
MVRTLSAQAAQQGADGSGGRRFSSVVTIVRPDKLQLWEIGFHGVLLTPHRWRRELALHETVSSAQTAKENRETDGEGLSHALRV